MSEREFILIAPWGGLGFLILSIPKCRLYRIFDLKPMRCMAIGGLVASVSMYLVAWVGNRGPHWPIFVLAFGGFVAAWVGYLWGEFSPRCLALKKQFPRVRWELSVGLTSQGQDLQSDAAVQPCKTVSDDIRWLGVPPPVWGVLYALAAAFGIQFGYNDIVMFTIAASGIGIVAYWYLFRPRSDRSSPEVCKPRPELGDEDADP